MSTRVRAMAVDGHSLEADLLADETTRGKVEVVILDILRVTGPLTDDEITRLYDLRTENYPGVPKVTAQRVRTARASLSHKGLVADYGTPGRSALGNPATLWRLNTSRAAGHEKAPVPAATGNEGQTPTKGIDS